jgi:hypothetical protein
VRSADVVKAQVTADCATGLGGTVMAEITGCDIGDCATPSTQPQAEQGSLLAEIVNFFVNLFSGSSSQPVVPAGYHRHNHYPAMYFITDSQAQLEEFTPDNSVSSAKIEAAVTIGLIVATIIFAPEVDVAVIAAEEAGEAFAGVGAEGVAAVAEATGEGAAASTSEITLTKTVANNLASRPYLNSPLTVQEIQSTGLGVPDPGGVPGALRYDVPGSFGKTPGTYQPVIHPETNTVYHFLFTH